MLNTTLSSTFNGELVDYTEDQIFKVMAYGFFDSIGEDTVEAGYMDILNVVNNEVHSCTIWLNDYESKSFFICIPSEEDEDEYDDINIEDFFGISYEEYSTTEYPELDVKETDDYPIYQLKYAAKYALMGSEDFTYIPLNYTIFTDSNSSSDQVGEMTFLHLQTRNIVNTSIYTTDFEDANLYVCLDICHCTIECECDNVIFLIDFNNLRIPLHEHITAQQVVESA